MKTCSKCHTSKPLDAFGKHSREADGIRKICRQCHTQNSLDYVARNKEKTRTYQAGYYAEHREHLMQKSRDQYHTNKDRARETKARYRRAHPEVARRLNADRRAAKHSAAGKLSADIGARLLQLQKGRCANCRNRLTKTGFHLDHVVPISRGGEHADRNMQLLCPPCNLRKFNKHPVDWAQENGRLL